MATSPQAIKAAMDTLTKAKAEGAELDMSSLIAPKELSMDEKMAALNEHLADNAGSQEGLSEEQQVAVKLQMEQEMRLRILEEEKNVLRKFPDATPDQQWQIALAMITGNTFDVLEHSNKMFSAAAEKEKQASARDTDLQVEGDSGGGQGDANVPTELDSMFSPGGALDASLANRSI